MNFEGYKLTTAGCFAEGVSPEIFVSQPPIQPRDQWGSCHVTSARIQHIALQSPKGTSFFHSQFKVNLRTPNITPWRATSCIWYQRGVKKTTSTTRIYTCLQWASIRLFKSCSSTPCLQRPVCDQSFCPQQSSRQPCWFFLRSPHRKKIATQIFERPSFSTMTYIHWFFGRRRIILALPPKYLKNSCNLVWSYMALYSFLRRPRWNQNVVPVFLGHFPDLGTTWK